LRFELPRAGFVDLAIYTASGQLVEQLLWGDEDEGEHMIEWDRWSRDGERSAVGVYFARLRVGGSVQSQKITLGD
jgi:hypothetical protein